MKSPAETFLSGPAGALLLPKNAGHATINTISKASKEAAPVKIQESAENYLEAILVLTQRNGQVRSIDVAHYTGFSKPSISRAVGLLRDNGYVSIDQNGLLGLTDAGLQIAETIYARHTVLTELLTLLGVSPETAAEDACRIEHVISTETFEKLKEHARRHSGDAAQ